MRIEEKSLEELDRDRTTSTPPICEATTPGSTEQSNDDVASRTHTENDLHGEINVERTVTPAVTQNTSATQIAELKEKISHLQVEISFMHGENDSIRKEQETKLSELIEGYEVKIRAHEDTNNELKKEIDALKSKYEGKCNDVKTLEAAQTNFESLLQNKDEIIESQKLIIGGVRKQMSETDALKSRSTIRNLEADRDELVKTIKSKDQELGEYSAQVEDLKTQLRDKDTAMDKSTPGVNEPLTRVQDLSRVLEDKIALLSKAEELVSAKQDLLSAKDEIIGNLKTIIGKGSSSPCKTCEKGTNTNLTSNASSKEDTSEDPQKGKNGVKESCEFIQVHAINGVVIDSFLLWADIQRKMHPENKWKGDAERNFVKTEITAAKETLWRIAGEENVGKMIKRQGAGKCTSEVSDICVALRKLAENDKLPLFLCTSGMVASTPLFDTESQSDESKQFDEHLNKINESIGKALSKITETISEHKESVRDATSNNLSTGKLDIELGSTIPIDDTQNTANDTTAWERKNQSWKYDKPPAVNQTDLVISKVELDVQGLQIRQHLANNGVEVAQCKLLTTRDDATFLSYRLRVKNSDVEKLKDPLLWPEGTEIRPYNQAKKKNNVRGSTITPRNNRKGLKNRDDIGSNRQQNAGNVNALSGTQPRGAQPNITFKNNASQFSNSMQQRNGQSSNFLRNNYSPLIDDSLINPLVTAPAGTSLNPTMLPDQELVSSKMLNGMQRRSALADDVLYDSNLPGIYDQGNVPVRIPHSEYGTLSNQWRSNVQQGRISPGNRMNALNGGASFRNMLYNPHPSGPRKQVRILDGLDGNIYAQQF